MWGGDVGRRCQSGLGRQWAGSGRGAGRERDGSGPGVGRECHLLRPDVADGLSGLQRELSGGVPEVLLADEVAYAAPKTVRRRGRRV